MQFLAAKTSASIRPNANNHQNAWNEATTTQQKHVKNPQAHKLLVPTTEDNTNQMAGGAETFYKIQSDNVIRDNNNPKSHNNGPKQPTLRSEQATKSTESKHKQRHYNKRRGRTNAQNKTSFRQTKQQKK